MLCSFLPGTGTGNVISDKDRIHGSRNTAAAAAATKQSNQHKVRGVGQAQALHIAKETLFIDLTLCEHGKCGENGCLTVVTG